jgi:hypothetical protein
MARRDLPALAHRSPPGLLGEVESEDFHAVRYAIP